MDYSKLSDFEINAAVAKKFPERFMFNDEGNPYSLEPDSMAAYSGSDFDEVEFDPCNNAADAWPIIQNSGISLIYDGDDWVAMHFSRTSLTYPNDDRKHRDKPFRAALILWLMMQESE